MKKRTFNKSEQQLGCVGEGYWRNFLKRNYYRLRSKAGKKFGHDRANFSGYLNFWDMYEHIARVLIEDSKIAQRLEEPVWMDRNGCMVDSEEQGFGCKVDIIITRPDLAFMMDEVGCNTSQEKDGRNGGETYLCGVDEEPYVCSSTKSTHFTCLGVTSFDGRPVMCVVIIAGKTHDLKVETGIDWKEVNKILW